MFKILIMMLNAIFMIRIISFMFLNVKECLLVHRLCERLCIYPLLINNSDLNEYAILSWSRDFFHYILAYVCMCKRRANTKRLMKEHCSIITVTCGPHWTIITLGNCINIYVERHDADQLISIIIHKTYVWMEIRVLSLWKILAHWNHNMWFPL